MSAFDIDKPSDVIGEGTYGCAHRPPMKCRDEPVRNKNDISKLMTSANAAKELKEFALIDAADKRKQFYLGKPSKCQPDRILSNIRSISKCPSGKFDPVKMDDYSLLVMKYGGQDLDQFGEEVRTWTKTKEHVDAIELFWLEAVRLFYGLKVLHDNNVVHHDIKQQNIVYDRVTNRANLIDFGFMEKKTTRIYASKLSANWLGNKHHWSFPFEAVFWNKDDYMMAARRGKNERAYNEFADSVATNCGYFFISTLPVRFMKLHQKNAIKTMTSGAFQNVLAFEPTDEAYDRFIDKSIDTVDSYGLGIALIFVLHRSKHLLSDEFYRNITDIIVDMLSPGVFLRSTPEQLLAKYEDILTTSGLLEKHNKHIENHLIADKVSAEMKVAEAISESTAAVVIDPTAALVHNTEIVRDCPVGKEFNPLTKRCVAVCQPGLVRDPGFKCVKPTGLACPDGFELNPRTRRCVKACKAGHVRNAEFKCVSGRGTRKTKKAMSAIVAATNTVSPIAATSRAASLVPSLLDIPEMSLSDDEAKTRSKQWISVPSDNWSKTLSKHSAKIPEKVAVNTRSYHASKIPEGVAVKTRSRHSAKDAAKTRSKHSVRVADMEKIFSRDA
jgi:serine/threonine protein kinase